MYCDRPLVYVAAPYTRPDPVENTHRLIQHVTRMVEDGVVTPYAPHLTLLWHLVSPRPVQFWYAYDLAILKRCDALFRVEGDSTGADAEVSYAEEIELPIFTDLDELYTWARSQW